MESLAADMFNKQLGEDVFTADSWTDAFMEYGCYCNKLVQGGGHLPGTAVSDDDYDVHENICMELYACYKCINIDYDHNGTYAASVMEYTAEISATGEYQCLDPENDSENHLDNCPLDVCSCDKIFAERILENYRRCKAGESNFCLKDQFQHSNGFAQNQCEDVGLKQEKHETCCGRYPNRKPMTSVKECCDNRVVDLGSC
ncbi:unnamed protein product [Oikopleura dioica]|uniref:Phospholipase A2 domain-containing protein n=2 Tax=Oikopleura dioica TaxID=34765 RepID=E4X1N4_OIKDI|nr:unnamed protein product [Oikopleura dioica]